MIDPAKLPVGAVEAARRSSPDALPGLSKVIIAAFLTALLEDDEAMKRASKKWWGNGKAVHNHYDFDRMREALLAAVQVEP